MAAGLEQLQQRPVQICHGRSEQAVALLPLILRAHSLALALPRRSSCCSLRSLRPRSS